MADVRPFRGLRYDPSKVGGLGRVIAPPYDVISAESQAALYDASPYNIVRVEYARDAPGQTRYQAASAAFASWQESGVLCRDPRPALYLVRHRFQHRGRSWDRHELMAAVRLTPWSAGIVLPHEATSEGHKRDRMELMKACRANVSPIMALYADPQGVLASLLRDVAAARPEVHAEASGEAFDVWPVTDAATIETIQEGLRGRLYVADGHHRYETALAYRDSVANGANPGRPAADYIMAGLISLDDLGLHCLAYHRWLDRWPADAVAGLGRRIEELFAVEEAPITGMTPERVAEGFFDRVQAGQRPLLGMITKGDSTMRLLRPKDSAAMARQMPRRSEAWRNLSPCIFAEALLEPALGMTQQDAEGRSLLSYPRDAVEAVAEVSKGRHDVAFLLDGVPLSGMAAACDAGERLPHKSTYFYPKLATGLVLNPLEGSLNGE